MDSIKPLRTDSDYREAIQAVERLINDASTNSDRDRLEILAVLIEAYEKRYHPELSSELEPIDFIKLWLVQNNLSRQALEPYLGGRARVSEVLSGKRPLTITMIRKLAGAGISADRLIKPLPPLKQKSNPS